MAASYAASHAEPCGPAAVQSVTTAPQARSEDRDERMRRYLIQMGIRTACFVAAFFTHGWLQIVLFAAAAILPYVAVVGSNNHRPYQGGSLAPVTPDAAALTAAPAERPAPSAAEDVVAGEVVEDAPALPAGTVARTDHTRGRGA